jgi:acetyl-CoA carboxylase biotin carboxyl carrier protein
MRTQQLQEVLAWIKTTDLVEVSFKEGAKGFTLASAENPPIPQISIPASRCTPILSPAIGIFQWSALGKPRKTEKGVTVSQGDPLGIVEAGKGQPVAVKAPCSGRILRIFIEAGSPVEFGQPLFFIEP